MWYTGHGEDLYYRIGYATSSDGINWTKYEANPVLSGDSISVNDPFVMKDDGMYKMWYWGDFGTSGIGLATSTDGINWTEYEGNPVLEDSRAPSVMKDNGAFMMWARCRDIPSMPDICYFNSSDGINWVEYEDNPVVFPIFLWQGGGLSEPSVLTDEMGYKMWFTAYTYFVPSFIFFGYTYSSDGLNWKPYD
jgi:predicted GH43/DUF377 family glycosyl hydrolase